MAIKRCSADVAFSKAARMARNNTCEYCGKSDGQIEACHIWSRRHRSVRWDTLNIVVMCSHHHRMMTENPIMFTQWLEGYVGQGYLDILNEKRQRIVKVTAKDRKDIARHYRQEIKHMEAGPHDLVSYQ